MDYDELMRKLSLAPPQDREDVEMYEWAAEEFLKRAETERSYEYFPLPGEEVKRYKGELYD